VLTFRDLVEGRSPVVILKAEKPNSAMQMFGWDLPNQKTSRSPIPRTETASTKDADKARVESEVYGKTQGELMGAGWQSIPKGTKGGLRKLKPSGPDQSGHKYDYIYPDGQGGYSTREPKDGPAEGPPQPAQPGQPPEPPEPQKQPSLLAKFLSKISGFFATDSTVAENWVKETYKIDLEDPNLDPERKALLERQIRMARGIHDPVVAASIARSTNVQHLLDTREVLLRLGAKEPVPKTPKVIVAKEKADGKSDLFPKKEKKPRVKKELTPEQIVQKDLNKMLALVNKRLGQIAPDIIADVSNKRVEDYLEELIEAEEQLKKEAEEALEEESKEKEEREKKKLNLGFITSASEIDKMQPPFVLTYSDDETLKFTDSVGGTFSANISELAGKDELDILIDKIEQHPELDKLKGYKPEQISFELTDDLKDLEGIDFDKLFPPTGAKPVESKEPQGEFNFEAPTEEQEEVKAPPGTDAAKAPKPKKDKKKKKKKKKQPKPGATETQPSNLQETAKDLSAPLPEPETPIIPLSTETVKPGKPTKLYIAGEFGKLSEMPSQWAVVEADSVITSHDPTTFSEDGRHTVGNERAYHRDKAEQAKVISQANDLRPELVVNTNPDATNGAPIIDENGVVLGGNSRSMSMKRVYSDSSNSAKANELRDYLKNNASQFGLTSDDVSGLKNPILVRQVAPQDDAEKQLLVRQLNENFTQAMDPRTMAVAQARRFDEKAVSSLAQNMEADETLRSFLDSKRGKGFIDSLKNSGIISQSNQNAYINQKTGKLNENGKALVENVIVGKMLPNADLLTQVSQKTMNAIARSAPYMMQASGFGDKYDIRQDLAHAMDALVDIQSRDGGLHPTDMEKRKEALDTWHRSIDAESYRDGKLVDSLQHPAKINPRAKALLQTLVEKPGPVQMSKVFKKYAEAVDRHNFDETSTVGLAGILDKKDHNDVFHEVFSPSQKKKEPEAKTSDNPIPAIGAPPEQGGLF